MPTAQSTVTHEKLLDILHYDESSGLFTWKESRLGTKPKTKKNAGCNSRGYVVVRIDGVLYGAHRLAWFYVHGKWPDKHIDHIDGNKSNNAIANLRDVTRAQNMQNIKGTRSHSKSGLLGVVFCKTTGRWKVEIQTRKKRKWVGRFDTQAEASAAYLKAKREMHECSTL